jgi:ketosteroid isomerase-like protein
MRAFVFAAALLAATPALAQAPDAAQVVAAERAFAADAPSMGIAGSFNKWSTPDAILIGGGQVLRVGEAYPDGPRPVDEPLLEWWPNFAGISRSGDLGFTTGGVQVGGRRTGHYFTVWKRQPGGGWKWIYDGGSGASAADVPGPGTEPVILPAAPVPNADRNPALNIEGMTRQSPSEEAMAAVRDHEAALATAAAIDQKAAHLLELADNGRLYVAPLPPAIGRTAFAEALSGWPATFRFGPTQGGGASDYGDLAWTYGPAAWSRDGQPRNGHYVRMWQRQEGGWKIVPPPPAGG